MTDDIQTLQDKLHKAREDGVGLEAARNTKAKKAEKEQQNMSNGIRAGTELVVSIIAGGGLGYGLDQLFGTAPWLLILFVFLGVCAGFWNIYKLMQN